jgi:hypothetical protein
VLATSAAIAVETPSGKWDARLSHTPIHDTAYYIKCMLGGVLSCGLTHTLVTPLDVAKCNMVSTAAAVAVAAAAAAADAHVAPCAAVNVLLERINAVLA